MLFLLTFGLVKRYLSLLSLLSKKSSFHIEPLLPASGSIMDSTSRSLFFFILGIALAFVLSYISANAEEIIINDTPLSDVTILPSADTSVIVQTEVVDEVSSGVLPDISVSPSFSQAVLYLKNDGSIKDELLLQNAQEIYFTEKNEYLQVKDVINVYQSPDGWGYQTVEKLKDSLIYTGYGPNANEYTYTVDISVPFSIASSTITSF